MIKLFIALSSSIIIFIASFFPFNEGEVQVQVSAPGLVKPGSEFIVEIKIDKGDVTNFARLQQHFPPGFTATPLQTANAEFIFENGTAKFIWATLPAEPHFFISYKVQTSTSQIGIKKIDGLFSFIKNDKTESYKLPPLFVNVTDGAELTAQELSNEEDDNMAIQRNIIQIMPERNEYKVTLTIRRSIESGAATFYDQLPDGYKAEVINTAGAKFVFENRIVKFSWDQLPPDSVMNISYFASSKKSYGSKPGITGMMVYGSPLNTNSIPLANYKPSTIKTEAIPEAHQISELLSSEKTIAANIIKTKEENIAEEKQNTLAGIKQQNANQNMLQMPGVNYCVQISATVRSTAKDQEYFQNKYNISDPVLLTMHDGWKKYIIGSFNTLAEAKAFQQKAQDKSNGAFIVAFNNGERITVSQARKIAGSNQASVSMK